MKSPTLAETHTLKKRGPALISRSQIGQSWLRLQQRGFALVTTLILMILITIIAVSMLTLSSVALRTSSQGTNQAQARANAKLALMLAISDLQKFTGPDQRVTATAELGALPTATRNLKWTGVWATTQPTNPKLFVSATNPPDPAKPVVMGGGDIIKYPYPADKMFFSDYRNNPDYVANGQKHLRLAWLVSGSPNAQNIPTAPTPSVPHITLVERAVGLASSPAVDPLRVTAPLVKIKAGAQAGGYAYWIGDESVKARIDQATPYEQGASPKQPDVANMKDGGFYNLMGGMGPDFTNVKAGITTPYAPVMSMDRQDRGKILSKATMAIATNDLDNPPKNFHDITTDSLGVICDVREGGLKKDLTAYLETTGDVVSDPSVLPTRSIGGFPVNPGLAASESILIGPYFKQLGPKFAQMRNWAALRSKVATTGATASIDPQYPPPTTMTGTSILPLDQVVDLAQSGQAIHPVITSYMMLMDFSLDASRGGGRALRTHFYPKVTLWNPYNVTLRGARYLIAGRGFPLWSSGVFVLNPDPIKPDTVQAKTVPYFGYATTTVKPPTTPPSTLTAAREAIPIPGDPNSGQWCASGISYHGYIYFVTDPVDIAPGECLVFVPDPSKSGGTKLASNSVRYDPVDISKNVLSATQIPGKGATNFYFPAGMQVDPAVLMDQVIPYGSNGGYTSWGDMSACCLKKTAGPTGTIPLTSVFNNASNETLQWINVCTSGGNGKYYFSHSSGNNTSPGLATYESNDDRVPLPGWAQEERQVYFSDAKPASTFAHNNLRAAMVHRSPFCNTGAYYDMVVGGYRDWYYPSINLNTTNMIAPYIAGYDGVSKLRGSPFAYPGSYSSVMSYPMFDVPSPGYPLLSLASLQHVQFGYQSWQPSFVLGHSICDIRTNRDASVYVSYFNTPARWEPPFGNHDNPGRWLEMLQMDLDPAKKLELNQYDTAFMVNQNLWDRYYLSSIPYNASGGTVNWDPVSGALLPNPHMVINPFRSGSEADMVSKIGTSATATPFDYSAYYLMNQGAFNINSVSVEAWRAFFSTLNTIKRPCGAGGGNPVLGVFSRMLVPPSDKAPMQVINDNGAWNGMKTLTASEIDTLSKKMVDEVKVRGPFLGLADFVNRRLGISIYSTRDIRDKTLMGPLQAAIESASNTSGCLNYKLANLASANDVINPRPGVRGNLPNIDGNGNIIGGATDPNCYYQWKQYGAGAVMNQADILQTLAPNMTARGDTFLVRGYGEARDANGKITAKAWCEAVVQRTPDYVVSTDITKPSDATGNNPMEPLTVRSTTDNTWLANDTGTGSIHPVNKLFGRKMIITKFRWLNASEV